MNTMNLDSSVMNMKRIMNSVFCKEFLCGMTTNIFFLYESQTDTSLLQNRVSIN